MGAVPGTFPGIQRSFTNYNPQLGAQDGALIAGEFQKVYEKLQGNVPASCNRLDQLDKDIVNFSPALDVLQRYLPDTEVFLQDIEEAYAPKVRLWNLWRTIFALAPLLLTWISLAVATILYKGEPAQTNSNTTQVIQSFLAQWQSGFGGSESWFKFSNVAIFDFLLIFGVVLLTIGVHTAESKPKALIREVEPLLDRSLRHLHIAIEQKGFVNPSNMQLVVSQAAALISSAVKQLENAAKDWKAAAANTEKTITDIGKDTKSTMTSLQAGIQADLATTQKKTQDVLNILKLDIQQVIQNEMGKILSDYRTTLTSFQDQVGKYTTASTDLVNKVDGLNKAAGTLAAQATAYTSIATEIKTNLAAINTSQTAFTGQVTSAAADMKTASTNMGTLVTNINTNLQPQLVALAKQAVTAGTQLSTTQTALATTNAQLATTTKNLQDASKDLQTVSMSGFGPVPVSPTAGRNIFGRFWWLMTGR